VRGNEARYPSADLLRPIWETKSLTSAVAAWRPSSSEAERRFHMGRELGRGEWLFDERSLRVVDPDLLHGRVRVARGLENPNAGQQAPDFVGQIQAAHAWHDQIGQQEMDFARTLLGDRSGASWHRMDGIGPSRPTDPPLLLSHCVTLHRRTAKKGCANGRSPFRVCEGSPHIPIYLSRRQEVLI